MIHVDIFTFMYVNQIDYFLTAFISQFLQQIDACDEPCGELLLLLTFIKINIFSHKNASVVFTFIDEHCHCTY